jgi:hypothetical protein
VGTLDVAPTSPAGARSPPVALEWKTHGDSHLHVLLQQRSHPQASSADHLEEP